MDACREKITQYWPLLRTIRGNMPLYLHQRIGKRRDMGGGLIGKITGV